MATIATVTTRSAIPMQHWAVYIALLVSGAIAAYIETQNSQREWHLLLFYGCVHHPRGRRRLPAAVLRLPRRRMRGRSRPSDCSRRLLSHGSWSRASRTQASSGSTASWWPRAAPGRVRLHLRAYHLRLRKQGTTAADSCTTATGPRRHCALLTVMYRRLNEVEQYQ